MRARPIASGAGAEILRGARGLIIGKITSSNSHITYVCQVYGAREVPEPPRPEDYGFGTFVGIPQRGGGYLVGVLSNTTLLNPEFGNLGPRLSPEADLAIFAPDYLTEKLTLVSVMVVGAVGADGRIIQGVPTTAAEIDAPVRRLSQEEVIAFHCVEGRLQAAYLPMILSGAANDPLMPALALEIIAQLERLFPQEGPRLALLRGAVAWRARVEPLG